MKHTTTEVTLSNGAKGLFIHVPGATVMSYEINFRAGEYLVEREKWETPHLMEHVLLGANELIPKARAFQAEFEKNGAYCNASTSSYDITYEAECGDVEWHRIAGLLLTAIAKPLFLEEEFQAEFGNVREELTARSNNHFRHLSLALREAYGFKVLTDQSRLDLMDNVTISDLREHYQHTHTTHNMRFVIAGKLPATRQQSLVRLLESFELPVGDQRLKLPKEIPKRLTKPLYIHNDTVENMYFYLDTFIRRRLKENEIDALSLVNTMLTETLYSRILGTARENGLVYSMSSSFGQTADSSNWWFGAQVIPDNAPALFDIIVKEIKTITSGRLSARDVTAAKQYALGRFQRSAQTVGGTAAGYSHRYFFDDYIDDYYKIPRRIRAVNKAAIVDITKDMFSGDIYGLGALGNCGDALPKTLLSRAKALWT